MALGLPACLNSGLAQHAVVATIEVFVEVVLVHVLVHTQGQVVCIPRGLVVPNSEGHCYLKRLRLLRYL